MKERYQLIKQVYYYLIKKNMGFCFLENGELLSLDYCINFLADNHLAEYDNEI